MNYLAYHAQCASNARPNTFKIKGWSLAVLLSGLCFTGLAQAEKLIANPYSHHWRCQVQQQQWVCQQTQNTDSDLYDPTASQDKKQAALVQALGWIADSSGNGHSKTVCGGHYYQPPVPAGTTPLAKAATQVEPGHTKYQVHGELNLSQGVLVTQPGRQLFAHQATIFPNSKTGKLQKITASGDIRLRQPGQMVLASSLTADLRQHHANMVDAHYLMQVSPTGEPGTTDYYDPNFTGYAHGSATTGKQLTQDHYILQNATYSTCPPTSNTWQLYASSIDLDRATGRGESYNTVLKVHGVPVFYTPYFNFPISSQRKSGFLYGNASYSKSSGTRISIPFYFNLAPNYDDTLAADFYSERGVLWRNTFRMLTSSSRSTITANYISKDKLTGDDRYSLKLHNTSHLTNNLTFSGVFNDVSDKTFLGDFSEGNNAVDANTVVVPRQATLSYDTSHWQASTTVSSYKVIDDALKVGNRPYQQLPSIRLRGQYPDLLAPLNFQLDSSFTRFTKRTAGQGSAQPLAGNRIYARPTLGLKLQKPYGYISPKLALDAASYSLEHYAQHGFADKQVNRTVPIVSLDSALNLVRKFSIGDHSYHQTLTPRLYYLYVPYRKQNDIPIFDTSVSSFNLSQMFSPDRFSGEDRIGDNNRLSAAVSSGISNDQGKSIINGTIAQAMYFSPRQVTVCTGKDCIARENPDFQQRWSDLLGKANIALYDNWQLAGELHYSYHRSQLDFQSFGLNYHLDPRHLFNISYQSDRFDYGLLSKQQIIDGVLPPKLNQINTSFLWRITPKWSAVGSWNYSITNNRTISQFGGFQYDSCCWALRVLAYRYIDSNNPNVPNSLTGPIDTTYMVQLQLKGLGSTSSTQLNSLVASIPGYNRKYSGFH